MSVFYAIQAGRKGMARGEEKQRAVCAFLVTFSNRSSSLLDGPCLPFDKVEAFERARSSSIPEHDMANFRRVNCQARFLAEFESRKHEGWWRYPLPWDSRTAVSALAKSRPIYHRFTEIYRDSPRYAFPVHFRLLFPLDFFNLRLHRLFFTKIFYEDCLTSRIERENESTVR